MQTHPFKLNVAHYIYYCMKFTHNSLVVMLMYLVLSCRHMTTFLDMMQRMEQFIMLWCMRCTCCFGVCHVNGKRPDDDVLDWRGLPFWDLTCSNTLAPSKVSTFSSGTSWLANYRIYKVQEIVLFNQFISLLLPLC